CGRANRRVRQFLRVGWSLAAGGAGPGSGSQGLRGVVAAGGGFSSVYGRSSCPTDQTGTPDAVKTAEPQDRPPGTRMPPAHGPQPVSITQEQMLRIEREFPALPQFNLPFAYRLRGPLNFPALKRSLAEVVRRHDALRMRFTYEDESPVALIAPASETKLSLVV